MYVCMVTFKLHFDVQTVTYHLTSSQFINMYGKEIKSLIYGSIRTQKNR